MVRRLLVVLLSIASGFGSTLLSQDAVSQEVAPAVQPPSLTTPQESTPQDTAKPAKEAAKPDVKNEAVAEPQILSEYLLPASTKAWISVPDPAALEQKFEKTQFALLAKDPAVKPFIESFEKQVKELLNEQNVRLGLEFDDLHDVHSGEICLAGVLPQIDGQQGAKGKHGIVLLVDVTKTLDEAKELQKKINKKLVKRGAKQAPGAINGISYIKSTIENPKRFRNSQTNFQAIVNGWLLVCDNEDIFRDVLRSLAAPNKIQQVETLSAKAAFKSIMQRTDLKEHPSHIRWYVDPFGYVKLAQALENEDSAIREPSSDDWSSILQDHGFSAFKGVGGNVSIATGYHEVLHRTFTYAPQNQRVKKGKLIYELFDLTSNGAPLTPPKWIPEDCSAYVIGNWEFTKALGSVGEIYDAFVKEEGAFNRMLNDFKVDPDIPLDIRKLVASLDNRMVIASGTQRPINGGSENVVLGFPIKGDPAFVFNSIKRFTRGEILNLGGTEVIKVDASTQEQEFEEIDDEFSIPGDDEFDELEDEEEEEPKFELFERKYFAVSKGFLLITNNKDYLKRILAKQNANLELTEDYVQVEEALEKLTVEENVNWRQFGRMDRTLETNYEMLRRGEMGKSQTILARVINRIFANNASKKTVVQSESLDEDAIRKQKLDGSRLPKDYAKSIAPYLGPMGWVMETEENGWRITGCVLKKKGMTEVVQKVGDQKSDSQQR